MDQCSQCNEEARETSAEDFSENEEVIQVEGASTSTFECMTRYKPAEFADEDASSVGSIQLNETQSGRGLHLRYHASRSPLLWRTRNILEKSLIVIIFVLLALLIILGCLIVKRSKPRTLNSPAALIAETGPLQPALIKYFTDENNICVTENCIHAASNILRSIDRSVQPCDDFYAYACNQWIKNNPIPDGKSLWGTFGKLEQQNHVVVKNVLERAVFKSNAEKKAKLYYESCLDDDESLEKLGGEPMKKLIRSIGGWNVTDSGFNISYWTLQQSLQTVQNRFNMGGLFSWAVGEDDRNSSRHVIQIDQGGLTLPTREHYLNKTAHEKVLTAYLDYMSKVGVLLGAEKGESEKQMADIIAFETKLADISTPSEDRRDEEELYHSMTIRELQERAPFINWQAHFNDALIIVQKNISENEKLVIYAPEYLEKLTRVICEYNSTEHGKIVLNNYLVWQTVRSLTACLSKSFRDAYKGLRKALIGSEGGEEPWRYCITDTNNVLGFAVGAMFVREVFHGEAKPLAEEMIDEVRRAFKLNLPNLKWMDEQTRKLADEKADAISDMIGFPDYILNSKELDKKYKDLEIDPKEYFQNNVRVYIFNLKKNLEKLDQSVNRTKWGMTPLTVNAYYTPTKNQIVFPAGILQLPFYDRKNPKSLNFGAIGVVMGHELTHAFDDQGREYDKEGNMHQWWNNKTIERFKNRTSCFEKQYSSYKINGRNLNGFQTLGENIADNGGLKAAFHAFTKSKAVSDVDRLPLPGLNLTQRQLFFVSFAQVWCSAVTDETTNLQIEKDPHSPPKYRVIGPLSNLKEFSEEFKCIPGTPMNPHKKCEVW